MTAAGRAGQHVIVVGLVLLAAFTSRLGASRADADALSLVRAHLLSRGAQGVGELARAFLFEGESRVHEERFETTSCVGFLALGFGGVRDVDLAISTRAGQPLAEDSAAAPYAYARLCGRRGTAVYVSALLFAGRGELVLLRVDGGPLDIGRLPAELPWAASTGGRIESSRAVGTAAHDGTFEGLFAHEERGLAELGYIAAGPLTPIELRAGMASTTVTLAAARCYRVVALVPFARGVGVAIDSPNGQQAHSRDGTRDRATAFVCADASGAYELRVESRALRSLAFVRVFEHPGARPTALKGHPSAEVLALAEAKHVAGARGLRLEPLGEAFLDATSSLFWPVTLRKGACYVFAVTGEQGLGLVDVRLADDAGVVLARNEGQRAGLSMFHCAARDGAHRLSLRARGAHAKVTLWLGRDGGVEP